MTGSQTALDETFFLLDSVCHWQTLFAFPRYAHADAATVQAILRAGHTFAEDVLAPTNEAGDQLGAQLVSGRVQLPAGVKQAYRQFCADGWPGFDLPREFGGQDLPLLAQVTFAEQINRANVAYGMLPIMLRAGAHLLLEHGTPDLIARVVPRLTSGEWGATICISEPQAGSDVGRITTRATPQADGAFTINGTKSWISYGDHDLTTQAVHFVLARETNAPAGTRGLSLFLVPRLRFSDESQNGWSVLRIEQKLGLHGSPTCMLNFENARGYRIGLPQQGLRAMFTMVNLMRLEVAVQGVAVASIAADKAAHYATQRLQGGPPDAPPVAIATHPDIQRLLLGMQARVRPLRALVYHLAHLLDIARSDADPNARAEAQATADWWLPVCKTCAAETAFEVASDALQVAGGFGYTRDGGLEQHLRDARVMAVYEGTSGIQALDLVARKVRRDGGQRALKICTEMVLDACELNAAWLAPIAQQFERATQTVVAATEEAAAAIAWDYLKLAGLAGSAWMWARMLAARTYADPNHDYRARCGEFFKHYWVPQVQVHGARISG